MPTPAELRAAVDDYLTAMNTNDRERYVSLYTIDATIEDPVGSDVVRGHDSIREWWDLVHSLADTIELVPTGPVRVAGREVAFPFQAVATTDGEQRVADIIDVMEFDDDRRIVGMRAFWDPAEARPKQG
jgi:steroid Delta-isomerase